MCARARGVAVGMRTVHAMAMLGEEDPFVTLLRQQRAMERSLLGMEQGPPSSANSSQLETTTTLRRQLGDSGFTYTERGGTEGASTGCAPAY